MPVSRIVAIAVAGEAALGLAALAWTSMRGLSLALGPWSVGATAGIATAMLLAVLNYALLRLAPDVWPVTSVRELYRAVLRPLFASVDLPAILVISLAAGVGEELFFRGAVQQEFGLAVASIVFGAAHVGGRRYGGFGVWAGLIGALLGWLCRASGGLMGPIVAHAVYDAMALSYVRWAPDRGSALSGEEENRS